MIRYTSTYPRPAALTMAIIFLFQWCVLYDIDKIVKMRLHNRVAVITLNILWPCSIIGAYALYVSLANMSLE